ncbi:putative leader peptide [Streptomyces sp. NPDC048172]|uniref:putative leader peptide n=1 Tax=Streptomyces sp. NPDC048172 TaxID=3365505 RepID=UPI00371DE5E9
MCCDRARPLASRAGRSSLHSAVIVDGYRQSLACSIVVSTHRNLVARLHVDLRRHASAICACRCA